ncbi:hypothetical protein DFH27DRAFT_370193 [Peziza echinospora]|nr:hypothetical protein DFH27DRAFT_370193 [Peziza echinospora]
MPFIFQLSFGHQVVLSFFCFAFVFFHGLYRKGNTKHGLLRPSKCHCRPTVFLFCDIPMVNSSSRVFFSMVISVFSFLPCFSLIIICTHMVYALLLLFFNGVFIVWVLLYNMAIHAWASD